MKAILVVVLLILASTQAQGAESVPIRWARVVVHISDSTHMTKEECDDWHTQRGWDGCGYNFVVEPDGAIYSARGYERVGAHVAGWNTGSLGFCFVTKDKATPEQLESYRAWLAQTQEEFGKLTVLPHRHFNRGKACPAGVWEQLGYK